MITLIILDHEVFAWNRIRTLIWVRDRDVTMVVGGNLRPLWQRLLTTGILVGVFNCLHNLTLPHLVRYGQLRRIVASLPGVNLL